VRGRLRTAFFAWLLFSTWPVSAFAQQTPSNPQPEEKQKSKPAEPDQYGSITENALNDPRNRIGLSFGLYEGYAYDIFRSSMDGQSVWATSLAPGLFVNAGKGQMRFHADYGVAYSIYNGTRGLNTTSHYGDLQCSYDTPQGASFYLSDDVLSGPNDFGSFGTSRFYKRRRQPTSWIELDYPRQRVTSNSLTGGSSFRPTAKSYLDFFGTYHIYRWALQPIRGTNGVQVGMKLGYHATQRLSLASGYAFYVNDLDGRFPVTRIQRLDLAGLNFEISRKWQASLSAGLGLTDYPGNYHHTASVQAGVSRISGSSIFAAAYERGFTTSIGLPGMHISDIVTLDIGQRLTQRTNIQLNLYYANNISYLSPGHYAVIRGNAVLEFALRADLVAAVHYSYWDQSWRDLLVPVLDTTRWAAYAGLQYIWCSSRP